MMLVKGLSQALDRLGRLAPAAAAHAALRSAAAELEASVKSALSHHPGEDHTTPWERTGTLHDSIAITDAGLNDEGSNIVIGSSDPVAPLQEHGTRTIPPRPFLAPTAASAAEDIVRQIAEGMRQDGGR